MLKKKNIEYIGAILFPMASFYFYGYVGVDLNIFKAIYWVIFAITFLYVSDNLFLVKIKSPYYSLVKTIFILILISTISAFIFRNQGFMHSYRSTIPFLGIFYYFYLSKIKIELKHLEKVCWILCIVYILCWGYSLSQAPRLVFSISSDYDLNDSRGSFRLAIYGSCFVYFAFFMGINKFVETRKPKWVLVFISLFVIILLHAVRQTIFFSFIIGAGYLFFFLKKSQKILLIVLSCFFILYLPTLISENPVLGNLVELTQSQIDDHQSGKENIRIQEYRYFMTEMSDNIVQIFLGNGAPHTDSPYGDWFFSKINRDMKFAFSDVGYASIYAQFGLFCLIAYLLLFFRAVRQRVSLKVMYAKLFIIYIIFANIAASWVFSDAVVVAIAIYILDRSNQMKNSPK